jgi:DNA-directed RNA polymerase sigma subunit (sigma70/sigma32)
MAYDRITPESRRRMKRVLKLRKQGKTLFEIGQELKVTRERIRQLESLALHLKELGKL